MKTAQFINKKTILTTLATTLVISLTLSKLNLKSTVLAQETNSNNITLTAIPPRLGEDGKLKVSPGEKLQVQLRVKNLSSKPVTTVTKAQDFIIDEDGETPIAINDSVSNRWSLSKWLTITPTEIEILPKQTVGFNVLIEVPKDALPGGHYAMILHQPQEATSTFKITNPTESSIDQRVGTLLYVTVEGNINEEAYIRNFNTPSFTEYGPVPFSFTVENNSDIHIAPQIDVEIYNLFNKRVDNIKIDSKNVFPLTSRNFKGEWRRVWGAGYYKAKLTMSYGTQGSIVVATQNFWLLPIKLVIATIVGLLIIIILVISIKKHLKHRVKMDEEKIAELEKKIEEMDSADKNNKPQE